jgi:hypothetical protein
MAYWFAGFFARPVVPRPEALPQGAVWREITTPFVGVGVRLPALLGKVPPPADVQTLARELGLLAADRWIYLTYTCWAGQIDVVYGLGSRGGVPFGPVKESARQTVKAAYTSLMEQFGIPAETALRFEPFTRGYWGDT